MDGEDNKNLEENFKRKTISSRQMKSLREIKLKIEDKEKSLELCSSLFSSLH